MIKECVCVCGGGDGLPALCHIFQSSHCHVLRVDRETKDKEANNERRGGEGRAKKHHNRPETDQQHQQNALPMLAVTLSPRQWLPWLPAQVPARLRPAPEPHRCVLQETPSRFTPVDVVS